MIAVALVVVGAVNWGLVGLFDFNLVNLIFSAVPGLEKIVYIVVGVAGVYFIAGHQKICKLCGAVMAKKS